jgi:hypothetical protein
MARDHGQRREERGRGEKEHAHRMPRRMSGWCAAGQRLPEGVFTTAPPGAPHSVLPPVMHTHLDHRKHAQLAQRWYPAGNELEGDRNRWEPERRSTPDLIGEARSSKSTWWRRKMAEGRIVCPSDSGGSHRRWPGSAGDGDGDIGRRRGLRERERGEWARREWAGSVWPTQIRVIRVRIGGGLGLAIGPRPNILKTKWIYQFCFIFK